MPLGFHKASFPNLHSKPVSDYLMELGSEADVEMSGHGPIGDAANRAIGNAAASLSVANTPSLRKAHSPQSQSLLVGIHSRYSCRLVNLSPEIGQTSLGDTHDWLDPPDI